MKRQEDLMERLRKYAGILEGEVKEFGRGIEDAFKRYEVSMYTSIKPGSEIFKLGQEINNLGSRHTSLAYALKSLYKTFPELKPKKR